MLAAHQQEARQHARRDQRGGKEQRSPADAVGERAEHRRGCAAQQALEQKRDAHGGEADARHAHEVDAEEGHHAHARRDGHEVGRHHDANAAVEL